MSPRLDAARRTGMPTEELSMTLRAKEHPPPRRRSGIEQNVCIRVKDGRFGSKLGQIGPKWDKSGDFFQIRFSTFWLTEPKCTESDLILGQSDPFQAHLTSVVVCVSYLHQTHRLGQNSAILTPNGTSRKLFNVNFQLVFSTFWLLHQIGKIWKFSKVSF